MVQLNAFIAVLTLAAISTTSAFADSTYSQASSEAIADSLANSKIAISGSFEFSGDSLQRSGELVYLGSQSLKDSVTTVFTSAQEASKWTSQKSGQLITASGEIINGSVEASGKLIEVVVDASGTVFTKVGAVVGSIANKSSELSQSTSELFVTASGELIESTGKVIGYVVDKSGEAVRFVVTTSGDILVGSSNASVAIIESTPEVASTIAQLSAKGFELVVFAVGDVSMTMLVTAGASTQYLLEGRPLESAQILLMLPSNILKAAFGSDWHYKEVK